MHVHVHIVTYRRLNRFRDLMYYMCITYTLYVMMSPHKKHAHTGVYRAGGGGGYIPHWLNAPPPINTLIFYALMHDTYKAPIPASGCLLRSVVHCVKEIIVNTGGSKPI